MDYGPGYRLYFGLDGDRLVVLLLCGDKRRQDEDIRDAKALWREYGDRRRAFSQRRRAAGADPLLRRYGGDGDDT